MMGNERAEQAGLGAFAFWQARPVVANEHLVSSCLDPHADLADVTERHCLSLPHRVEPAVHLDTHKRPCIRFDSQLSPLDAERAPWGIHRTSEAALPKRVQHR